MMRGCCWVMDGKSWCCRWYHRWWWWLMTVMMKTGLRLMWRWWFETWMVNIMKTRYADDEDDESFWRTMVMGMMMVMMQIPVIGSDDAGGSVMMLGARGAGGQGCDVGDYAAEDWRLLWINDGNDGNWKKDSSDACWGKSWVHVMVYGVNVLISCRVYKRPAFVTGSGLGSGSVNESVLFSGRA